MSPIAQASHCNASIKLEGVKHPIDICANSSGKYFFNKEYAELNHTIAPMPQADSTNNKSKYYPHRKNAIDYKVLIAKTIDQQFYPLLEQEEPLKLNNSHSLNSIVIAAYREDNTAFHFILKYDFNPHSKQVELSELLYVEHQITAAHTYVSYYRVKGKIPHEIKQLSDYNRRQYTHFIVHNLFHKIDKLALNLVPLAQYDE
ncbi:hypothetical protein [Celerinatantimonas sp. MCCC 1A17872]|uniref:hypothetical protein n=1 Tax=Celerinatantimonas sp. MCCC 1A17872 TaxID=3177514 RepID=UPI0038C3B63B